MKKVLFIAYNFPPHGGSGVQRSAKFVKYLRDFGWDPIVLTSTEDDGLVTDPSLGREIPPDIEIHRVKAFGPRTMIRWATRRHLYTPCMAFLALFAWPDLFRIWAHRARRTALQLCRTRGIEVIYTTAAPYSTHLLGLWLQRHTAVPWFADFRDPWSGNYHVPYLPGLRWVNRILERRVLRAADRVACVSDPLVEQLWENGGGDRAKYLTLTNGYDESDVSARPWNKGPRFTMLYAGTFFRKRRPNSLLAAVRDLMTAGRLDPDKVEFLFVGRDMDRFIPSEPPFRKLNYVAHGELDRLQSGVDAFLLVICNAPFTRGTYTGKIFEYIALDRPILAIVPPDGVAADLIRETRTGTVVPDDRKAVADAVEAMYREWEAGNPNWSPQREAVAWYSRRSLTQRLAACFDELAARNRGPAKPPQ